MNRATFREKAGDVAWQRQLRDRYLDEGTPPVPHLDVKRARVVPVSRRLAEQIILKYEWLGTMSATKYHFGIFYGPYCAGVCCVGKGGCTGGTNNHKMFGIQRDQLLILARGACVHWAPTGSNSKLVSWTCKLMAQAKLGKVMIAYSDTDAGEIGTIYQACNWTYIGLGSSTRQWVAPNGRAMDQKLPANLKTQKGGNRKGWVEALRRAGWGEQASNPKHRYIYVLDRDDPILAARIERMKRPYPKRERDLSRGRGADSGTPEFHSGGDGARPIRPLQPLSR